MFLGICLATMMAGAADLPRPAKDFAIKLTGGKQIQISQYKGKVCVLAFILTTCPHCQKTVGFLSALQKELGPRGLQVVASAIEDGASTHVTDFVQRFQPGFPVGFNELQPAEDYLQHPAMLRLLMPQLIFIDRHGVIRAQYSGDDKFFADNQQQNLRTQIEALLKPAAPTAKKRSKRA
ncbi:MAG TPA: TlpA disulfide reductase family protein [Bryobacteraceae bacterium]|nr:TlpA disulfide reductase family protein [Bryobacteraceae bacterium]